MPRSRLGFHGDAAVMVAVSRVAQTVHIPVVGVRRGKKASMMVVAVSAIGAVQLMGGTGRAESPAPTPPTRSEVAPPTKAKDVDDEGPPKLSLPTEADRDAWLKGGFRFSLGLVYGALKGLSGVPSGRLLGLSIRPGLRLDADWSLVASFQYALASQSGGLSGLRFAGTVDPTWHATRHLSLAMGIGFGGIVEGSTGRRDIDPLPSTLNTSYTFPTAHPSLPSCGGVGAAGLVRAEWTFILGPRAATGVGLEAIGQWTGCVSDTGRVEPDSGRAIVRRQWWPHIGATVVWGVAWR